MTVEERLRATTEAVSASLRPVRTLNLPDGSPAAPPARRRLRSARRRTASRPVGWLVPLAAAAAVVLLAATLVTVRTLAGGTGGSPGASSSAAAGPAARASGPKYYVTPWGPGSGPQGVTVYATATGRTLFKVRPSQSGAKPGQVFLFSLVFAAADGRSFLLGVTPSESGPVVTAPVAVSAWDLLRINQAGTGYTLRRLPVPGLSPGTQLVTAALSPDAAELAVMSYAKPGHAGIGPQASLRVYAAASGRPVRAYTAAGTLSEITGSGNGLSPSMTWLSGGAGLNFGWGPVKESKPGQPARAIQQVRHLDLAKPDGNLLASSTVVTAITGSRAACGTLTPTADGKGAVCGSNPVPSLTVCRPEPVTFRYYSGLRGASRLLYALSPPARRVAGTCWFGSSWVLWASPSGSALIGTITTTQGQVSLGEIGIVDHGHWTRLSFHD